MWPSMQYPTPPSPSYHSPRLFFWLRQALRPRDQDGVEVGLAVTSEGNGVGGGGIQDSIFFLPHQPKTAGCLFSSTDNLKRRQRAGGPAGLPLSSGPRPQRKKRDGVCSERRRRTAVSRHTLDESRDGKRKNFDGKKNQTCVIGDGTVSKRRHRFGDGE